MPNIIRNNPMVYLRNSLRIVLVEPAGGLNVGAIARVMKNMGVYRLILVKPKCDPLGADARQMAVHADDVLASAAVVESIAQALHGCQRVIATTARDRDLPLSIESPTAGLRWLLGLTSQALSEFTSDQSDAAILFGPEDRGLSNAELIHAQRLMTIPTNPDYASLNLAQAVAICCYELNTLARTIESGIKARLEPGPELELEPEGGSQLGGVAEKSTRPQDAMTQGPMTENTMTESPMTQNGEQDGPRASFDHASSSAHNDSGEELAPFEILDGYYQHLEETLHDIGYLYPHTAKRRMEKFRILFNRSNLSRNEVAMLRGILRQVKWAIAEAKRLRNPDQ